MGGGGGVYVVNTKNRAPVIFVSKDMCTYICFKWEVFDLLISGF